MKKNALKLIAVLCAATMVCAGFAQGQGGQGGQGGRGQGGRGQGMRGGFGQGMRGGMGGHLQMLNRTDVQADLKLTDDQKSKLTALRDKMQEERRAAMQNGGGGNGGNGGGFDQAAMRAMMEANQKLNDKYNKEAAAILTADQNKRFLGIRIQLMGDGAINDAEVQKAINLTDAQKAKLKDLNDKAQAANQSVMEKMRNQEIDREAGMESFRKNQEVLAAESAKILTDEQKAKLKELSGAKFEAREQGRGGNGGGGGGRGGNGGGR